MSFRDPAFFEQLFPQAGKWNELIEARKKNAGPRVKSLDRNGVGNLVESESCFTEDEVGYFNTIFERLADNIQAKAALAGILQFTQFKDDCAGF